MKTPKRNQKWTNKNNQTNTALRTRYWPIKEEPIHQNKEIQSYIRNCTGNQIQLFLGKNMLQIEKQSDRFV